MCNCKKKNEQVKQRYYVPATDTQPEQIIETVRVPQTPDELLSEELNKWNGGPQINEDGQTRET